MPSSSRILVFDTPGVFQWIPGPHVYAFEPIVKAAGGGGASGMSHTTTTSRLCGPGGGGGAIAVGDRRLSALDFLRGVEITVGAGGAGGSAPAAVNGAWNPGTSGGFSAFGDVLRAEGGFGGGWALGIDQPDISFGGDGGHAILRGGKGGSFVTDPGITHSGIVRLLAAGGGGGRGSGYNSSGEVRTATNGGSSGPNNIGAGWRTLLGPTHTAGHGGSGAFFAGAGYDGQFPCGGGGGGAGGNPGTPGGRGGDGQVVVIEYIREPEV
ncbi:glycine-rich domain-containing protein [Rhodococcus sp. LW-XY12]|uniref:glycine-rich domain-containing protein n=1 Tax=unclassified Rhodococcus (in: high G+C Gram-positive bacteria) TaxID=192944 RepID=UPI000AC9D0AB